MYSKLAKIGAVALMVLPLVSSAALGQVSTIDTAFNFIFTLLNNYIMPLIIALAGLYFVWGLLQYVAGGDKGKDEAKGVILWGIIILVVMLSFWGLVNIVKDSLFSDTITSIGTDDIPQLPTGSSI